MEAFQAKLERIKQVKPTAVLPKWTHIRAWVHWVKPRYLAQVEFTEGRGTTFFGMQPFSV
jgi:bifunctional non-homologous end joining protein LigD